MLFGLIASGFKIGDCRMSHSAYECSKRSNIRCCHDIGIGIDHVSTYIDLYICTCSNCKNDSVKQKPCETHFRKAPRRTSYLSSPKSVTNRAAKLTHHGSLHPPFHQTYCCNTTATLNIKSQKCKERGEETMSVRRDPMLCLCKEE